MTVAVLCADHNCHFCSHLHFLSCSTLILGQHLAVSTLVCAAIARLELWVSFPSCTVLDAKFVMSFSGMLQEHSASLLMFLLHFDSFLMSQKFFTKLCITKMLSSVIVLCMAKKHSVFWVILWDYHRGHGKIFGSWLNCSCDLVWLLS